MSRLFKIAFLALLVVVVEVTLGTTPALAALPCVTSGGPHYYNRGFTFMYNMYGGHARATEQNYYASDWPSTGFVDQTLWVNSGSWLSDSYWAEIGFGHGWEGQNIKYFYYARVNPSFPYAEFKLAKSPGGAGTLHTYEIIIGSNGAWNSKIDGASYAYTSGFENYSQWIGFGGEATSSFSTMPSSPANQLYYMTSAGAWSSWSSSDSYTGCAADAPYQWAWTTFPSSATFWK